MVESLECVIVINTVSVQNLLEAFVVSLGKTLSFASWFWQAVLNFSHISIKLKNKNKKFQADSNILASPEAGRGNCLANLLVLPSLSCESGG